MKPSEPTRFTCAECQIAFDLTVAPFNEWREMFPEGTEPDDCFVMPNAECPFCGARKLQQAADQPTMEDTT